MLQSVLSEMYTYREISEAFYDFKLSLDTYHEGNIWNVGSTSNYLTRSKVLYYPTVI